MLVYMISRSQHSRHFTNTCTPSLYVFAAGYFPINSDTFTLGVDCWPPVMWGFFCLNTCIYKLFFSISNTGICPQMTWNQQNNEWRPGVPLLKSIYIKEWTPSFSTDTEYMLVIWYPTAGQVHQLSLKREKNAVTLHV